MRLYHPEGTLSEAAAGHRIFQIFQNQGYLEHYHKRSNVEATNVVIKSKFGETLKSKNQVVQVNKILAKIIAYNQMGVIHEIYENGIELSFLSPIK